jgi:predicted MPP superfamily phosphohydrolase
MKLKLYFLLFFAVYFALNGYIGWHGALFLSHAAPSIPLPFYWSVFAVITVSYLVSRTRLMLNPVGRLLKVIGSYYFFVLEYALLFLPVADLAALVLKGLGRYSEHVYVLAAGSSILIALAVLFAWGSRNAWSPVVRTYNIEIPKQAGQLKQLRIVAASDLHLGNIVGNRHLQKLTARIEEMSPDLILLPGDVIDEQIEPFVRNRMSKELKRLKARYGVYAVLGNHEYYGGHIGEYVKLAADIGIRVLQDESVLIENSFYVVGRKDKTAEAMDPHGRMDYGALLNGVDKTLPIIAMDHQPRDYAQAEAAGVDLLLSGHTHRGQFAPNHWVTRKVFELDWGYLKKGNMHAVVSSGYGTWGPALRIASRAEIVQIIVRFAPLEGK